MSPATSVRFFVQKFRNVRHDIRRLRSTALLDKPSGPDSKSGSYFVF
jgi:hypothetical protein